MQRLRDDESRAGQNALSAAPLTGFDPPVQLRLRGHSDWHLDDSRPRISWPGDHRNRKGLD